MSYDLSVWCIEPFRDPAALADAGEWKPNGDGWMIEGRGWLLHAGRSEAVLDEDLPDEVRGALPGIAQVVHLSLEPIGAPKAAYSALKRTAKLVSRAARGAVFDPQAGTVELPPGAKRYAPPPAGEARISLLELSWWFDHSALLDRSAVERLFELFAAHAPEALPRRYGLHEPPQHALEETGREHAVRFLAEGVVWYCTPPFFHVFVATGVLGPLFHRNHRGPGDRPVTRRHTSSRRRAARRRERAPLGGGRMSFCLPERVTSGRPPGERWGPRPSSAC